MMGSDDEAVEEASIARTTGSICSVIVVGALTTPTGLGASVGHHTIYAKRLASANSIARSR
jgi:hypothetical protein